MRLLVTALLVLAPLAHAQERGGTDEEAQRERIRQIAEGIAAGRDAVAEHDSLIVVHAATHEIDPDWLRAIIVAEAIRPPEEVGTRLPPTGMDPELWGGLDGAEPEAFADPDENIRLAALLLRRLLDRLPEDDPAFRVVASLYDDIGTQTVTEYGLKAEQMLVRRAWAPYEADE